VSVKYLDLADYLAIAVEITGLDIDALSKASRIGLADSALHAPAAGFGETDLYPDFVEKTAVLLVRLAKNHPLPDGNKRAAWVAMRLFIEDNGWTWAIRPSVDDAERAVLSVASGEWGAQEMTAWLAKRIQPPTSD